MNPSQKYWEREIEFSDGITFDKAVYDELITTEAKRDAVLNIMFLFKDEATKYNLILSAYQSSLKDLSNQFDL